MRRVASVILFLLGGWFLTAQLFVAYLDAESGSTDNFGMTVLFMLFVLPFLLLGAWASPGNRWRELGLTILIAVGASLLCGVSVLVALNDPGMKPFIPPMPEIEIAPVWGIANLAVVTLVGWLLYRGSTART
ncbi:MAG: hypothetical protein ABIO43_12615 [Sphingomicrobium sp.]